MNKPLNISLIQTEIIWEDSVRNLEHYTTLLSQIKKPTHIAVLPEMFDTGFTNNAKNLAQKMNGPTLMWMKNQARINNFILCGSTIIEEDGHYYNRFIWMQPNGEYYHYDKAHLFGKANENEYYTSGSKRVIVSVNGWKILLQVCYDLRFPVWARQQHETYDAIIYVANWPELRIDAWTTLLKARAIENQAYVFGVNCVGTDGNDIVYSGESAAFHPEGRCLWTLKDEAGIGNISCSKDELNEVREKLPFLNDRDGFMIT